MNSPHLTAVSCRGIAKTYGSGDSATQALRGVDLDVPAGELVMLVGPSGCGKTTLISVIAGILAPDAGCCHLFGQDLAGLDKRQLVRLRGQTVGFVFQAFNLVPTLTAVQNTAVPLLINGLPRAQALDRARQMLGEVGLARRADARPGDLSGGQQQRVAIARAIVHQPRLVVCDEPTSALDHKTGAMIMELLKRLAVGEGRSLVIVTHDQRIFDYADQMAHMDDGRIENITHCNS